jgi:Holliday junction resolvase
MNSKKPLGRPQKLFDTAGAAHAVVRAAEALNWNIADADKFLARVQHVEYGLSAEIEFATILRWLGVCQFVHRLNEDRLAADSFNELEVPDLFAVFRHGAFSTSALIEVKTSEDLTLDFSMAYLDKLARYASLMEKPLLIAWRPRTIGFWVLFDPLAVAPTGDRVKLTFDHAIKNDLMGYLAGDTTLVSPEGCGMRIVAERTGEKMPTERGYQAEFIIRQAYFHDADGIETKILPAVTWLVLSTVHYSEQVTDDAFVQCYTCEGATRAQLVLRTAVGFSTDRDERIHWKAVHNNLNAVLDCERLLAEAETSFGSYVQYILYQRPQLVPAFLFAWEPPHAPRSKSADR